MTRSLSLLVLLSLFPLLPAQQATDLVTRLEAKIEAFREEQGVPGVGCAARTADGTLIAFGSGTADVENDVPCTEQTVFRLASISKPVTAVAALRLVERGELDLDRPVDELVPGWPTKRWPVTPRHLLGHLGGVRHYRRGEILSNRHYDSVTEAIAIFAPDPLEHEPGTRYRYTTYGYNLLGAAVEAAAKQPFADVLREEVFEPAGCTTLCIDDSYAIIRHRAQGYDRRGGQLHNSHPVDTSNKVPGGGLCGTPTDLVRFAAAVLDGKLLKAETVDRMWTPMQTADGKATGYGMGWNVGTRDGRRFAMHGGAQPRVSTLLYVDRDSKVIVAVMANLEGAGRALRSLVPELVALCAE